MGENYFFNFYEVRISFQPDKKFREYEQLAYVVDHERFLIIIDKSGHPKMMRGMAHNDFEGGWIFPCQGKITFYSGFLGSVSQNKDLITEAVSRTLKINLRPV